MVSVITLPSSLDQAPPLQVALGAALAAVLAYKLLLEEPAHVKYAKKHGLPNIKPARKLKTHHFLLGDVAEIAPNAERFPDWTYEKTLEMNEEPWLRDVPSLPPSIVIAKPELVEDVVKTQNDWFGKGEFTRTNFDDLIGDAFFSQDGPKWFHQRKIASKFFTARMLREVATGIFNKHAEVLFGVLARASGTTQEVDLSKLYHQFTLQAISDLGFGLEMDLIGSDQGHILDTAFAEAFPQILRRVQTPQWIWKLQRFLNIGGERKYRETTRTIRGLVGEMVSKSIAKFQSKGPEAVATNLIELFIQAMHEDDTEPIPAETLCDIAIMFSTGGRDTTADTLTWVSLMIGQHPEVERKLRAELWDKVPELMEGKISTLTLEHTQRLTYLEAVIKETLRLYPPVPLNGRQAERDTHLIDGTFVPKGYTISLSVYTMGRLKSVWGEDALAFNPERFIDQQTGKLLTVPAFKFFSFHAGPRVCIGMNLAMLEIKLVIATLLSRFKLDTLPNDGSYRFSASLPIKNPLLVRVEPARAPSS